MGIPHAVFRLKYGFIDEFLADHFYPMKFQLPHLVIEVGEENKEGDHVGNARVL